MGSVCKDVYEVEKYCGCSKCKTVHKVEVYEENGMDIAFIRCDICETLDDWIEEDLLEQLQKENNK